MKVPDIDRRTRQDIVRSMRRLAAAYTPEWRFDTENPDVGTALALIYAELFEGTIKRFNQSAERHRTAFFNTVDAKLLPAIPATGYASFGLAGTPAEGVAVARGTQLVAEAQGDEEENPIFETRDDLLVTPASISDIFYVCPGEDAVYRCYSKQDAGDIQQDFPLFLPVGDNLQSHVFHLCFGDALNIARGAHITLDIGLYRRNRLPDSVMKALGDTQTTRWFYLAEEGYRPFGAVYLDEAGRLHFVKDEEEPAFVRQNQFDADGYWISCETGDVSLYDDFVVEGFGLVSRGFDLAPDVMRSAGAEQPIGGCFAFGEKFGVYDDFYLGCAEALGKRGARVTLSFDLDFARIPIDLDIVDPEVNWKYIMKRSDFKQDRTYDITVEDVIWEYYNGKGWARLFSDDTYRDVFCIDEGQIGRRPSMSFICPADMSAFLMDAQGSYYIRARILKVNNAYKMKGDYLSPYISEVRLAYDYADSPATPYHMESLNNLESQSTARGMLRAPGCMVRPFAALPGDNPALYFAFDMAPVDGPVKILFTMKGTMHRKATRLGWEYLSSRGWRSLSLVDETEGFKKTGLLTLVGNRDFRRETLWNREAFWVRATDTVGTLANDNDLERPVVTGLYMNTTHVVNEQTRAVETFSIRRRQENFSCELIHKSLQHVEVWVNELGEIDAHSLQELDRLGQIDRVCDASGEVTELWIRWREVEDFASSTADERCYTVDRNTGVIAFSDGIHGRIPPPVHLDGIRVHYATGGGAAGNLEPGRISRPNRSIGFVNRVANPTITSGGYDQETTEQALTRSASALRHRHRGVTGRDYEQLAFEASRTILKARCFDHRDEQGCFMPGAVTLVLLQRDFEQGQDHFAALKKQVHDYMAPRINGNMVDLERFFVCEPTFIEISVSLELTVRHINDIFEVREQVKRYLDTFLHPSTGNFGGVGWSIGSIPNRTQILNCLNEIPQIAFIKNLYISAHTFNAGGRVEADLDRSGDWPYALPMSGVHEMEISLE